MSPIKDIFDNTEIKRKPEGFARHREKIHEIIFEAETTSGKLFDIVLLIMIF